MHYKPLVFTILRRYLGIFKKTSSARMEQLPLVVVLGATGAGKSKLALDLAARLNGEIISADSMQVYKGLDIVTNKVTPGEQAICPHHLIGFLPPLQEYTIVDFKKHALKLVDEIHGRRKLPIICGGTNYYIESLLWEYLVPTNDDCDDSERENTLTKDEKDSCVLRKELEQKGSMELHEMLRGIDPERASELHPHDRRKVIRSIEVYEQSGKKHSDLMKQQRGDNRYGGSLLFTNVCLIYVTCEEEVLQDRINRRVDKMIHDGLLDELLNFHKEYNRERLAKGLCIDYEHGIFQSIGFKEFHSYLTHVTMDDEEEKKMFIEAVERMKISTWQYAKYQTKWIRKRIINRKGALPVYGVDSTKPELWKDKVLHPSLNLLSHAIKWNNFVEGVGADSTVFNVGECEHLEPIKPMGLANDDSEKIMRTCDICGGKIFLTENQWQEHVNSKRHKKIVSSRLKKLHSTSYILDAHENNLRNKLSGDSGVDNKKRRMKNDDDEDRTVCASVLHGDLH